MPKISTKISKSYRYTLYAALCSSCFTGSAFWLLRRFAMVEGDFGPESHVLQYPFLQAHGLSAFVMLLCLGGIFASHIPKTWSTNRAKRTGATIVTMFVFSIISAYSLYYLVTNQWHEILGNIHAIVGIMLPLMLAFHIYSARKYKLIKKLKKSKNRK